MGIKKLIPILVVAAALRLWGIGWGLPSDTRPVVYYTDEYGGIQTMAGMNPRHLDFRPRLFHNPTFFWYQVGACLGVASAVGYVPLRDQTYYASHRDQYQRLYLVGRYLVVFYGVLCVWLMYVLTRELFDERSALLAAGIFAVTPIAVYSAHFMEISASLCFWSGCYLWACIRAAKSQSVKWIYIASAFFGLAMGTKYLAAPLILILLPSHYQATGKIVSRSLVMGALIGAAFFLLVNPYVLIDFRQFISGIGYIANASGLQQARAWDFAPLHLSYTLGWPLSLVSVAGLIYACFKKNIPALAVAGYLAVFFFILSAASLKVSRYFLVPIFFLVPFGAHLLVTLGGVVSKYVRMKWALPALVALVVGPSLIYTLAIDRILGASVDPRDLSSAWIAEHIPAGSTIGVIGIPYWYSPGIIYREGATDWRFKDPAMRPHGYNIVIGDVFNGTQQPPYLVVSDIEYKQRHGLYSYEDRMPALGYAPVASFTLEPSFWIWRFPKRNYFSTEWVVPYPNITVWSRTGGV